MKRLPVLAVPLCIIGCAQGQVAALPSSPETKTSWMPMAPRDASAFNMRDSFNPLVVRSIQQRLRELGFYQGAVDGKWRPATQKALSGFQRSSWLEPSGRLNPLTAFSLGLDPNNLSGSAAAFLDQRRRTRNALLRRLADE